MSERTEMIATADGTMETFFVHPDGSGPYPVLIQLMDGIGMREQLRDHARRAAAWGYYVIAPDLFYRWGLKGPLDFSDAAARDKLMSAIGNLTSERATADVQTLLGIAAKDAAASDGKIGLYGFCMGGKLTLELSQSLGERVAAGASIHPGSLVTDAPSSPHRHIDRVAAKLYFGIADRDAMATPDQMAELEKALKAQGVGYELEWHPGAMHGFMMRDRAEMHHEKAAETVWGRMQALFARELS